MDDSEAAQTAEQAHKKVAGPFTLKQRVLLAILPPVATALIRVLCATLRFKTWKHASAKPADEIDGPDIYAFWHRCLLLAAYRYRNLGIRILISQSFDGELIARIVQRLGFVPIRGSSSRGGAVGLLALSRALADGHKVAITVDGPKGPRYAVKPGAASIALRQAVQNHRHPLEERSATISPFYLHPSQSWTLRSWDRFLIPKPFSRICCAWTEPVVVSSTDRIDGLNACLQSALDAAVIQAESA